MGGGGDRMPFETLHSKDIKMPHVYHISSQTGGTHYKKRFQTLQTLLYADRHLPFQSRWKALHPFASSTNRDRGEP